MSLIQLNNYIEKARGYGRTGDRGRVYVLKAGKRDARREFKTTLSRAWRLLLFQKNPGRIRP